MVKKGLLFAILISAFLIGMAFGNPAPAAPPAPQSRLEEAIALYEEAVATGGEYVPWSQQVAQVQGLNDNAVGRLGQGIGDFLHHVVRELLRTIVMIIDNLIGG